MYASEDRRAARLAIISGELDRSYVSGRVSPRGECNRRYVTEAFYHMRLLLIGAPGAGKGTQAELLAARFGIAHISSGDLLRQHVREQTSLGRTVKSYLDRGDLVPDDLVMTMLRKPVLAAVSGYVLDGFPRTVEQAKASYAVVRPLGAEVQAAIHLAVPREELMRRLLARGRGSEDGEAVIEHRLKVYEERTVPLLDYYAGREWMFTVDGARSADAVHEDIAGRIQKLAEMIAGPT
jgi:adenylate kinase